MANSCVKLFFRNSVFTSLRSQGSRKMLALLSVLFIMTISVDGKRNLPNCSVCEEIVKKFKEGLESTAKSNYGGGNTKWEEKSLGSYATSEVRLVEIIEHLCEGASKECHTVLEEHEEMVERYWFKEFGQKKDTDLYTYLCIEHMKACCPSNTYGLECKPCPGDEDRPCTGNGKCDGGGTRKGTGKCKCSSGYKGDLCENCQDSYFEESKNDTHTECNVCHFSCKDTCWEDGPKGCDECKEGWLSNEEIGCQDINECTEDPCAENKYCTNTQGSYTCFTCDDACSSCSESGAQACTQCNNGYTNEMDTNTCTDVNECGNDFTLCTGENQVCENKPGSYECACKSDFYMKDNACQPIPKEENDEGTDDENKDENELEEKEEL